jgi:hypothetical protein
MVTFTCAEHDCLLMYNAEDSGDFLQPAVMEEVLENGNRCEAFTFSLDHCWCPNDSAIDDEWERGINCRKNWLVLIATGFRVPTRQP